MTSPTSDERPWVLYGAGGVTGRLIVDAALRRGQRPILAGRSAGPIEALAEHNGLPLATASIDDPPALARLAQSGRLMLNAAGPFHATALPLARAAIAAGVPYVDVNGEVDSLIALKDLDGLAHAAGVPLIGGAGYGVAAGECLARHVVRRLPGAVRLRLGLDTFTARKSPGARASTLGALRRGGYAIQGGRVTPEPIAEHG